MLQDLLTDIKIFVLVTFTIFGIGHYRGHLCFTNTSCSFYSLVLSSMYSLKCSDIVYCLFHEVLLFCCRHFPWTALILFLPFSWDSIDLLSTFPMKYFDTIFGLFHEIWLFCGRCFQWSALIHTVFGLFLEILLFCGRHFHEVLWYCFFFILFLAFFLRFYYFVNDLFL